jgi:hypothetical protein
MSHRTAFEPVGVCARGCVEQHTDADVAPVPRLARHGLLCDSCFFRLYHALTLIPEVMTNMRILAGGIRAIEGVHCVDRGVLDRSSTPLRIGPVDASDSVFAKLVSWAGLIGEEMEIRPPSVPVWVNRRETQGARSMTPESMRHVSSTLVEWFLARLETITSMSIAPVFHDDVCYGWEDAPGVFWLVRTYGIDPPPPRMAVNRECPVCGREDVSVEYSNTAVPGSSVGEGDIQVVCGRCRWVANPEAG